MLKLWKAVCFKQWALPVVAGPLSQPEGVPDNVPYVLSQGFPGCTLDPKWPSWKLDALASHRMHHLVPEVTRATVSLAHTAYSPLY